MLRVAHASRAQDVKRITDRLRAEGHAAQKLHRTVHRPWGSFTVLEDGANHKIKRLAVKPGACISLQLHQHRSEHWVVVEGEARVTKDSEQLLLTRDQSTYIPAGTRHRLHLLSRLRVAEPVHQLDHVLRKRLRCLRPTSQRAQRGGVGSRSPAEPQVDAPGVERGQGPELLRNDQR